MKKLTKAQKEVRVRSVRKRCRGPRSEEGDKAVAAAFAEGDNEFARKMDRAHREPCGYDVNDLILSQPLDGEEREANCPDCGQLIRWVPAPLDLVSVE